MKHIFSSLAVFTLLLIAAQVAGCHHSTNSAASVKGNTTAGNDTLIYGFRDATTPPQYHRSYDIIVTAQQVKFSIMVYGDVLVKDSLPLTKQAFETFASSINALQISNSTADNPDNCVGGSSQYISFYPRTDKWVKASTYNCGGKEENSNDKKVNAAAALFSSLVPDLGKRIEATRK